MPDLRDAHQLLDAAADRVSTWGYEAWWRGHADAEWKLQSGLHRKPRAAGYEQNVAHRFKRSAGIRHGRIPASREWAAWLFLMQHYRLPTRLLDWTESPLIALFFAVWSQPDRPGALWALQPFQLNQAQINEGTVLNPDDSRAQAAIMPAFGEIDNPSSACVAVYPEEVDIRLAVQLSAFTVHGSPTPLEELPGASRFLIKYVIPVEAKRPLAESLDALGIRRANVFPDLENLAGQLTDLEF